MNIKYIEDKRLFKIDTEATSYVIGIVGKEGFVGHAYYGESIEDDDVTYLLRIFEGPFTPDTNERDRLSFYDCFPFEYPTHGIGDFRESALRIEDEAGHYSNNLKYKSHMIYKGKKGLAGLPATWGNEEDSMSLELTLSDYEANIDVVLTYSIFEGVDAVVRSAKIINNSGKAVFLTKAASASIDLDNKDFDKINLYGSWARERHINRTPVSYGIQGMYSKRGEPGHQEHPFTCLLEKNATQTQGEVYGMDLIYSGNFRTITDRNQFDLVRLMTGINPEDFRWKLENGDTFVTPEAVLVYSNEGIGGMSRSFHDLYREHLIRGYYRDKKRPILINNWEATYFDFNEQKLISIVDEASKLGIEMLVMDDGWFGNRFDDNSSLGDWFVNEDKLKGGIKYLVDEVNKRGMKFGIWFEPEMISPVSKLYEAHPEWAIHVEGRKPGLARNQMVLDYTRKDVRDYIYGLIKNVLSSANIEYVKWDMNRPLSDIGGAEIAKDRLGEFMHRYTLGVYEVMERLVTDFPKLLLENCSGGGGRFDAGMLYFGPQIWCSDDADAIERLVIQEGTELIYPLSAMGAHVSDCPNHIVGRVTPFRTRGHVALAGTFGYELDVTRIPEEDRNMIPAQIEMYHKYNDLVRTGDYYRIASYAQNGKFDCWQVVSKDKTTALVTCVLVRRSPNTRSRNIKLQGLACDKRYRLLNEDGSEYINGMAGEEKADRVYYGLTLMNAGINVTEAWGDNQSMLIYVKEV
ncbi:MAG: alpha-galactosidase [Lachnospiraceae bacterium]|nr:alpha-galactosidase [Lachnospiraceae bacterium]